VKYRRLAGAHRKNPSFLDDHHKTPDLEIAVEFSGLNLEFILKFY
jgi:hypothetical protein